MVKLHVILLDQFHPQLLDNVYLKEFGNISLTRIISDILEGSVPFLAFPALLRSEGSLLLIEQAHVIVG